MSDKRDFMAWEALLAAPLVKEFEGCRLDVYLCPAGIASVGWGHTGGVRLGQRFTQEEVDRLLTNDLEKHKQGLAPYISVAVTRGQFCALLSFAYNVGVSAAGCSSVVRRLNAGDIEGAAKAFAWWNKSNGKVLPGLVRRRKAEAEAFLS